MARSVQLPAAVLPADGLAKLARLDPPPYRPAVRRGSGDAASGGDFSLGMELYQKGSFAAAIPPLSKAATGRVDAAFFLAACYLLTGDGPSAANAARAVIASGDTPYREEAQFLLAKALLAQQDAAGAEKELKAVVSLDGDLRGQAVDLLAAIESVDSQTLVS